MLCKKVIFHRNRTFLYKKYIYEVRSIMKDNRKIPNAHDQISKGRVLNGGKTMKNYILSNSFQGNSLNPGLSPLLNTGHILQQLDSRFIHSVASSLTLRTGGYFSNCRWKSTDVSQLPKLTPETMPGISIDCTTILQNSSTTTTTDKLKEISYIDTESAKQILKEFPAPKNVLHNAFDEISRQINNKALKLTPHYKLVKDRKQSSWICTYHIHWPEEIKFMAKDPKKSVASHKAAIAALIWLKDNNKITNDGLPVTYGKKEVRTITKKTLPILSMDDSTINKMQKITQLHRTKIVPHIVQTKLEKIESSDESDDVLETIEQPEEMEFKHIRSQKYLGLDRYLAREKVNLPIAAYK